MDDGGENPPTVRKTASETQLKYEEVLDASTEKARSLPSSSSVTSDRFSSHFRTSRINSMNVNGSTRDRPWRGSRSKANSVDSAIHVQITDIVGDEEAIATTFCLRMCKNTVLQPYTIILVLIGWRRFRKDSPTRHPIFWCLLNKLYPCLVFGLLLFYAVMNGIACPGKLDFREETTNPSSPKTTRSPTTTPVMYDTLDYFSKIYINKSDEEEVKKAKTLTKPELCAHRLPMYVLPSAIFIMAYVYGFYTFRVLGLDEELYALMERVFLQSSATFAERTLIRNSRWILVGAGLYLLLQIGLQVLYNMGFETEPELLSKTISLPRHTVYPLALFRLLGQLAMNIVNVALVVYYCAECEMVIIYVKGIIVRLREKRLDLRSAMHDILAARDFISKLNDNLGKISGLYFINFSILFITGLFLFLLNQNQQTAVLMYRACFPILWFVVLFLPLVQASRVTSMGERLKRLSYETRVFGYQNSSDLELDSFLLFVSNATLRTKVFGLQIRTSTVTAVFGTVAAVALLLVVSDVIKNPLFGSYI